MSNHASSYENDVVDISSVEDELARFQYEFQMWEHDPRKQPLWVHDQKTYLEKLFPYQIAKLQAHFEKLRPTTSSSSCRSLLLVCGTTLQPLLLAVALHQPQFLYLIVNDDDIGQKKAEEFHHDWLNHPVFLRHWKNGNQRENITTIKIKATDPVASYQTVARKIAHLERSETRIDITGGKKSMSAVGFLLASHFGLDTWYLDGKSSHKDHVQHPDPASIEACHLHDPTAVFRVRDIERIKTRYELGDDPERLYTDLQMLLDDIQSADPHIQEFLEYPGLQMAADYIAGLVAWRNADYLEAYEKISEFYINDPFPLTIQQLYPIWEKNKPDQKQQTIGKKQKNREQLLKIQCEKETRKNPKYLLHYVLDEFFWISQKTDERNTFLRAFVLGEMLIEACVRQLQQQGHLKIEISDTRHTEEKVLEALYQESSRMLSVLRQNSQTREPFPYSFRNDGKVKQIIDIPISYPQEHYHPFFEKFAPWEYGGNDTAWRNLRNSVAHRIGLLPPDQPEAILSQLHELLPDVAKFVGCEVDGVTWDQPPYHASLKWLPWEQIKQTP